MTTVEQEVSGANGEVVLGCVINEDVDAIIEDLRWEGHPGAVEVDEDGRLTVLVDGHTAARLAPSDVASRLTSCIERGHSFLGVVTGPRSVHVQNGG